MKKIPNEIFSLADAVVLFFYLVKGSELDTTHVFRTLKNTERVYRNKTSVHVVELEKQRPGEFDVIRPYVSGSMVSYCYTYSIFNTLVCRTILTFHNKQYTVQRLVSGNWRYSIQCLELWAKYGIDRFSSKRERDY